MITGVLFCVSIIFYVKIPCSDFAEIRRRKAGNVNVNHVGVGVGVGIDHRSKLYPAKLGMTQLCV